MLPGYICPVIAGTYLGELQLSVTYSPNRKLERVNNSIPYIDSLLYEGPTSDLRRTTSQVYKSK